MNWKKVLNFFIIPFGNKSIASDWIFHLNSKMKCKFTLKVIYIIIYRNKKDTYKILGKALDNTIKLAPKGTGVIIFFTNYNLLNKCYSLWESLFKPRKIFVEIKDGVN